MAVFLVGKLVSWWFGTQEQSNYHGNATKTNLGLRVFRVGIEMHVTA